MDGTSLGEGWLVVGRGLAHEVQASQLASLLRLKEDIPRDA